MEDWIEEVTIMDRLENDINSMIEVMRHEPATHEEKVRIENLLSKLQQVIK